MSHNLYKLRCSLPGHSKDVRCVTVGDLSGEQYIVSGSRDKTAKLWAPEGLGFVCNQTFSGNEGYISAVAVSQPSESLPCGAILTGCQDGKIRIYNPGASSPVSTLSGHTDTVCALAIQSEFLLSGSWDKTAKIWHLDGSSGPTITLTGHTAAIWAVELLSCSASETLTLTGSADKTIKLWQGDSPLQVYKGHTDCVRALAVVDVNRFLSAANDATVRLWAVSGECLSTYYGHTNYIYGLSIITGTTDFVSCGEDRSLRIWKLEQPDECLQTVFLPAQSVWAVAVMKNSDIVTGSSDGIVRVFTRAAERTADPEVLKVYEAELGATSLNSQLELGGIKATDLPGPESLFEPGTKEGQTKMVRQGETIACYSWSSSEMQWVKVGDVVGAAGQSDSTKTLYQGKEYDYVFSVDIAEGQPPLKLPYNMTDDPWQAAQKFIHDNDLSQYYLDTVANFIITNSKGGGGSQPQGAPSSNGSTYTDPFTGGSRYMPGTPAHPAAAAAAVPAEPSQAVDPFTGGGRYIPQGAGEPAGAKKPQNTFFPVKTFLRFDQANLEAITNKLKEFNGKVDQQLQLSEPDLLSFVKSADLNSSTAGRIVHIDKLLQWPSDMLLPVLDVLRLASRSPNINSALLAQDLPARLLVLARSSVPNCMMVYRTLAHCIMHVSASQKHMMDCREAVLASLTSVVTDTDPTLEKHAQWKNVQVAVSTVLLNYASLAHTLPGIADLEAKSQLLTAVGTIVPRLQEEEALFRILVAAGTLLGDPESVAIARSLELDGTFEHLQGVPGKVGECAKHLLTVF